MRKFFETLVMLIYFENKKPLAVFSRERLGVLCFTVGEPFGVAPQRCSLSFLHCKDKKKFRKRLILFCSIYVKKYVLFCSRLILFCSHRLGLILFCSPRKNKNIMKGGSRRYGGRQ